ncbi:hypothetical protein L1049_024106 [Liquidambar formosana]|uniref:CASP-like protein n=1 Tax=Liquidambar formosana TaxID=63359 RepID=A0AAP0RUC5_LIQFO
MAKTRCTLFLRLIAFIATLSAAITMATSHEMGIFFSTTLKVDYSDSPAFKHLNAQIPCSSAAMAILYVNNKGNLHVNWIPFCNQFPKYCGHVVGALVAGFIGVAIYMVFIFYSIHKVINPLLMQKVVSPHLEQSALVVLN